ncbi:hypothetical protein HCUR_00599 [Holospora curviuscula]|uniref:Transposase n=1 Tax=Holospora curviuscula TaxID=1082868 RepID=A0A2S5R9R9_9PROT|nr:hypothetical protein HCUR_00599 [Holospora curviuscula]
MIGAHRRHDMSDHIWSLLEPRLPGRKGSWGGIAHNNRLFTPPFGYCALAHPGEICLLTYGNWKNTHWRFCRWRDKGVWKGVLESLVMEPDFEWLIDLMQALSKYSLMQQECVVETKPWDEQKGAQFQNTYSRRCDWYASTNLCYIR